VENVAGAAFRPDSLGVVLYTPDLQVESWDITRKSRTDAYVVPAAKPCLYSAIAPDGKMLACVTGDFSLRVYEVATGSIIFEQKDIYNPTLFETLVLRIVRDRCVEIGFSPDARYLLVTSKSSTDPTYIFYDLRERRLLPIPRGARKYLTTSFAFTTSDRIIGLHPTDPQRSAIFSVPAFETIQDSALMRGNLDATSGGGYLLVRPAATFAVGLVDPLKGMVVLANRAPALDVNEQFLLAEMASGELGLYSFAKKTESRRRSCVRRWRCPRHHSGVLVRPMCPATHRGSRCQIRPAAVCGISAPALRPHSGAGFHTRRSRPGTNS